MRPRSLFSLSEHLERLSKDGDPLEALAATVEFERFRSLLTCGLGYPPRSNRKSRAHRGNPAHHAVKIIGSCGCLLGSMFFP